MRNMLFMLKKISITMIIAIALTNHATASFGTAAEEQRKFKKGLSGIAADIQLPEDMATAVIYPKIINEKVIFSPTDEKAVWWCECLCAMPATVVKWYAPDGSLYKEEKLISSSIINWVKAELPIKGAAAAAKEGKWKVVIFRREQIYDEVWFYIGKLKEKQRQMGED